MAPYEPYHPTQSIPDRDPDPIPLAELTAWQTDYGPELKRIADALEKLVRPVIGFTPKHLSQCIVCERVADAMQEGFILGYGSAHDGEWVCAECIHRLVDAEVLRLAGITKHRRMDRTTDTS